MSDYPIDITLDPQAASGGAKRIVDDVRKVEAQVEAARKKTEEFAQAAKSVDNLANSFKRVGQAVAEDSRRAEQALGNLGAALARVGRYQQMVEESERKQTAAALGSVRAFEGLAKALEHEKEVLKQIRGPLEQHQANVEALNKLLARGTITAKEHAAALAASAKSAGGGQLDGIAANLGKLSAGQAAGAISQGFELVNQKLHITDSGLGSVIGSATKFGALGAQIGGPWGAALGGIVGGITDVIGGWFEHSDAVDAAEKSLRRYFASASTTADIVERLDDQAAHLGVSVKEQAAVFATLHEATEGLYLTTQDQIKAQQTLSEYMQLQGRDAGDAAKLMGALTQAMADGHVGAEEYAAIQKEFPDLAKKWASAMGTTTKGLKDLAGQNKLGSEAVRTFFLSLRDAKDVHEQYAKEVTHWNDAGLWYVRVVKEAREKTGSFRDEVERTAVEIKKLLDESDRLEHKANNKLLGDLISGMNDAWTKANRLSKDPWGSSVLDKSADKIKDIAKATLSLSEPIANAKRDLKALDDAWAGAVDHSAGALAIYKRQRQSLLETITGTPIKDYYTEMLNQIVQPEKDWHGRLDALNALLKNQRITVEQYTTALNALNTAYAGIDLSTFGLVKRPHAGGTAAAIAAVQRGRSGIIDADAIDPNLAQYDQTYDPSGYGYAQERADIDRRTADFQEAYNTPAEPDLEADLRAQDAIDAAQKKLVENTKKWNEELAKATDHGAEISKIFAEQLVGAVGSFSDTLLDAATGADVSFKQWGINTLETLGKLIFKAELLQAITGNADGSKGAGVHGGWGGLLGFLGGATGLDYLAGAGRNAPGFATGGDIYTRGVGSTDSMLAMLRITPGESLHIRTPEQRREAERQAQVGQGVAIVNQAADPRALLPMLDTPSGYRMVYNVMRRIAGPVRSLIQ